MTGRRTRSADGLTDQQRQFVVEYLKDYNGKAAATRAGYAPKAAASQASDLLTRPHIQRALAQRQGKTLAKLDLKREDVLRELKAIGFAKTRQVVKWGTRREVMRVKNATTGEETEEERVTHGLTLVPSDELDDETAAAVSEVRETRDGVVVKMHSKTDALDKLARHLGLYNENDAGSGPVEVSGGLPEEPQ